MCPKKWWRYKNSQKFIEDFFKKESHFSKETQEFVKAKLFFEKVEAKQIDPAEIEDFFVKMNQTLSVAIQLADKINFSRGYEKNQFSFPSHEEMKELICPILDLIKKGKDYKKVPGVRSRFNQAFKPFLDHLETLIRQQALKSRRLQLIGIEKSTDLDPKEKDFKLEVTAAQVSALESRKGQHWFELKDLLNLSRLSFIPRTPSGEELKFFHFITLIYDELESSDESDPW